MRPSKTGSFPSALPLAVFVFLEEKQPRVELKLHSSSQIEYTIFGQGENIPEIIEWLFDYSQKRQTPSLPFTFPFFNTSFTSNVLKELVKVPFGESLCYSEVARRVGAPKAFRAVGRACHTNPLPLFIPCHRVVAKDGGLGGYAFGLSLKRALLQFEHSCT